MIIKNTITGPIQLVGDVTCKTIVAGSSVEIISGDLTVDTIEDDVTLVLLTSNLHKLTGSKKPILALTVSNQIGNNVRILTYGHYDMSIKTVGKNCSINNKQGSISVDDVMDSSEIINKGSIQCLHLHPKARLISKHGYIYVKKAEAGSYVTALNGTVDVDCPNPNNQILDSSEVTTTVTSPNFFHSRWISMISLFNGVDTILDIPTSFIESPNASPTSFRSS
jgi:activator of HSP90 ATPase